MSYFTDQDGIQRCVSPAGPTRSTGFIVCIGIFQFVKVKMLLDHLFDDDPADELVAFIE
jgi:hypothetical protein